MNQANKMPPRCFEVWAIPSPSELLGVSGDALGRDNMPQVRYLLGTVLQTPAPAAPAFGCCPTPGR